MNYPSKERAKRAQFAAEDIVDNLELLFEYEGSHWEDNGPIRETRKKLRKLLHYVQTGESK